MDLHQYITPERWERFKRFSDKLESPFLVIDLDVIRAKYAELRKYLPYGQIYYAVKANPHPEVIALLRDGAHRWVQAYSMARLTRSAPVRLDPATDRRREWFRTPRGTR